MNAVAPIAVTSVRAADLGDRQECARLDAFVQDHPDGTIFHRPQWSRAVARGCGQRAHYLIVERQGALIGCLPLVDVRSALFGRALVSVGFGTGGGLLTAAEGVAESLAEAGWALAQRLGCPSLELRGGRLPEGWAAQQGTHASFDRELPADVDTLLRSIPKKQRAEVMRARRLGLETSAGNDRRHRDVHFHCYAESMRNLGTPIFPRTLFEAMLDEFGTEADVVVAWNDERPLAAFLNFYFKGACFAYWGGGGTEARSWRANDLLYFDVMARAIARGCTRADIGRSKVGSGTWQRKRIWGFDETPLVYGVRTADGAKPREVNPLNPRYRMQIAAWQRLPLWLANRAGPLIARGLG
jgi:FemAB-related protein (PEP-CTERM system-associated)